AAAGWAGQPVGLPGLSLPVGAAAGHQAFIALEQPGLGKGVGAGPPPFPFRGMGVTYQPEGDRTVARKWWALGADRTPAETHQALDAFRADVERSAREGGATPGPVRTSLAGGLLRAFEFEYATATGTGKFRAAVEEPVPGQGEELKLEIEETY